MPVVHRAQTLTNFLLMLAPYPIAAWTIARIDGTASMWLILALLLALRVAFAVLESIGSWIAWSLIGRRIKTQEMVRYFRDNNYPPRPERIGVRLYLQRLADGAYDNEFKLPEENDPGDLKEAARQLEYDLEFHADMRFRQAVEDAFNIHSPIESAPAQRASAR